MSKIVFPGSFCPLTLGHLDFIQRAAPLCDTLVVAILCNPSKSYVIPLEARLSMLRKACAHLPNVQVDSFSGLLADYVHSQKATFILRGLRGEGELSAELPVAALNRKLSNGVETLFLPSDPALIPISSSAVREIAAFGGDWRSLVPETIADEIAAYLIK